MVEIMAERFWIYGKLAVDNIIIRVSFKRNNYLGVLTGYPLYLFCNCQMVIEKKDVASIPNALI
ncbi:hypothetical protein A5893_04345 [Pedobacter psychrophilus]|uniref:Uncharacterized protein n=1 Tax=Pedobacter psychrophilus TaxID=1826909 RepID=A0A179DMR6_9SPHI|nr:hypothetical protein A5893_04345 [Pedobacter psychrophilus]